MATYGMLTSWEPYLALFAVAFVAATLLPAQSEALLVAMVINGLFDPQLLLLAATTGNTLGSVANWILGRFTERFRDRRWFPFSASAIERAERWYGRWGKWSLLLSWAPIFGDALTFAAGLMRTPLKFFLPLVLVAKGGRYLILIAASHGLG
ncbi:MAG: YqaA family protein [Pseudomonadota bacterium]|jgi:membrane protein YqaA with SNARE-associated domain